MYCILTADNDIPLVITPTSSTRKWPFTYDVIVRRAKALKISCYSSSDNIKVAEFREILQPVVSKLWSSPHAGHGAKLIDDDAGYLKLQVALLKSRTSGERVRQSCAHGINFNRPLESLPVVASSGSGYDGVPAIMAACVAEVEKRGLGTEWIYRLSNSVEALSPLKRSADEDDVLSFMDVLRRSDVAVVSSLLLRFLRQLPRPLLSTPLKKVFVDNNFDPEETLDQALEVLKRLPKQRVHLLAFLFGHFYRVARCSVANRMSIDTVAESLAGCIYFDEDPESPSALAVELDLGLETNRVLLLVEQMGAWPIRLRSRLSSAGSGISAELPSVFGSRSPSAAATSPSEAGRRSFSPSPSPSPFNSDHHPDSASTRSHSYASTMPPAHRKLAYTSPDWGTGSHSMVPEGASRAGVDNIHVTVAGSHRDGDPSDSVA